MSLVNYQQRRERLALRRLQRRKEKKHNKLKAGFCKATLVGRLRHKFENMLAGEALDILINEFKYSKMHVEFATGRQVSMSVMADELAGFNVKAKDVGPLKFWGAPPGKKLTLFTGSLLTVFLERLLHSKTTNANPS